jgi:hypothetical protein
MPPSTTPAPPRRRSRLQRTLLWSLVAGILVFVTLSAVALWMLRPAVLKPKVEATLSDRLNLQVTIAELSVSLLPRPRVSGKGLTFRIPGRPDLPPFIDIGRFWMDVGLLTVLRRHVETVHLDDMKIAVPPDKSRDLPAPDTGSGSASGDIVVDHLITHNAELRFVPDEADDRPLIFEIHELTMDGVGFARPIDFKAKLTNPVPRGEIETQGTFGPWRKDHPTATELKGLYSFLGADLSTIDGIGGRLASRGSYGGRITEIHASGTTETPDFNLDLGGKPVPLSTSYEAVIDGTNGSTRLTKVDAKLGRTMIQTSGMIRNLPGPDGHDIKLTYAITDGRIEDVLRLAMDSPKPMLTGDITLRGTLALPPGREKVRRRLRLSGRVGLEDARFSSTQVQEKLQEFSRRSQGIKKDDAEDMERVMTDLAGEFALAGGVLEFRSLSFEVPGATVALAGTYAIDSEALDLNGTLRMKASASTAMGGVKSIFLKPFDFIFRKDGAGAVVPIRIAGTRDQPKMGIQFGKVFGRGK